MSKNLEFLFKISDSPRFRSKFKEILILVHVFEILILIKITVMSQFSSKFKKMSFFVNIFGNLDFN